MATTLELEFDTTGDNGAPLGDVASSLVSLHDLLRDLGSIAAYPTSVEFREIQVVAIEMRNPLKVKLSLVGISDEAVKAFQEICRDIIRLRSSRQDGGAPDIARALALVLGAEAIDSRITEAEAHRLRDHVAVLQRAAIPLKRVAVSGS
jgi:hypothetical protein